MIRYEHTQRGTVVQVALLVTAIGCFALAQFLPAPPFVVPLVLIVLVTFAYVFSSLTIQVTDRALHWCVQDHEWFQDFGETFCVFRPPQDLKSFKHRA